ncbi:hypothetical protein NTE_00745 [Candidatus Nitrososphaera evergladensis SR1]|uniref:Uncharacterized protein n=1 Tax=Candidatus Nitrososphaera evergladensis SR1 TaxID=1459636 RepID=A0A075MNN6_9ARCH|nr:hypothetical protein [Candidatus Nitrososphaera evergladensis]AIF82823.1 hypothetical protein NTE_00745 [Candidatus Nitrososphaera evergladensis SR1]
MNPVADRAAYAAIGGLLVGLMFLAILGAATSARPWPKYSFSDYVVRQEGPIPPLRLVMVYDYKEYEGLGGNMAWGRDAGSGPMPGHSNFDTGSADYDAKKIVIDLSRNSTVYFEGHDYNGTLQVSTYVYDMENGPWGILDDRGDDGTKKHTFGVNLEPGDYFVTAYAYGKEGYISSFYRIQVIK